MPHPSYFRFDIFMDVYDKVKAASRNKVEPAGSKKMFIVKILRRKGSN